MRIFGPRSSAPCAIGPWAVVLLLLLAAGPRCLQAAGLPQPAPEHLYTTWRGQGEADKWATMWLIKRRLDPEARFEFFPRGTTITRGTTFEVPFARLERAPGRSLFETLLERIPDPGLGLVEMGRIIHDLEINTWGEKLTAEAAGLKVILSGLAAGARDDREQLERALVVFDALYAGVRARSR